MYCAGNISSLGSSIADLETAISTLNVDLQCYTVSLLPCVNIVAPTVLTPFETALSSLGNSVQGLLSDLDVGGVLNGLITTIIP